MKCSDERYTPEHVISLAREMWGQIDLDPCTPEHNPTGAMRYYSEGGLEREWHGKVWVNPPYSRGQIKKWVNKAVAHVSSCQDGEHQALILLPSDLGTHGGATAARAASGLCFVRSRLTFGTPTGAMPNGAKQPSIIVYIGDSPASFSHFFSRLGVVWTR